jgi:endogenous inhibitor of DNA gyrase (YacG/DUF329 family)
VGRGSIRRAGSTQSVEPGKVQDGAFSEQHPTRPRCAARCYQMPAEVWDAGASEERVPRRASNQGKCKTVRSPNSTLPDRDARRGVTKCRLRCGTQERPKNGFHAERRTRERASGAFSEQHPTRPRCAARCYQMPAEVWDAGASVERVPRRASNQGKSKRCVLRTAPYPTEMRGAVLPNAG